MHQGIVALPAPPAPPPPTPPPPTLPPPPATTSPLVYVGFTVGGTGLLIGLITGIVAVVQSDDLEQRCPDRCTEDEIERSVATAHVSTAGFAVGAAGVVLGGVGLALTGSAGSEARASLRWTARF